MDLLGLLVLLGGVSAAVHLLWLLWSCWSILRQFLLSQYRPVDLRTYGQWAVVTGATSGIGKAYAIELAKRGLDIVLLSRRMERLQAVAKEIENQYGCKTQIIQADFTEGDHIYPAIGESLQGLDIGILVNNVGMNYAVGLQCFLDVPNPEERITQVINCNILSVTQMTRLVLPHLVARGKGLIINMSSEAASQPQPLLSLYSATKIFVTYFSRSLGAEYRHRGVTVQCVAPFTVSTKMTYNAKPSLLVKTASDYAHEALNTVGYSNFTSGCISHALQHAGLCVFFPVWLRHSSFCVGMMERFGKKIRKQVEKKAALCQKDD